MSGDITIDLSGYKDKIGSRLPAGRYRVLVDDAELDRAKQSGNQMINVYLRVIDGEHKDAALMDRLVLTDGSMFRVVGFLQAIGIPTPRKRFSLNLRQIIGRALFVDVEDGEPYLGRIKSEVRGYARAEQPTQQSDDLADLEASLQSVATEEPVAAAAAPNGAQQKPAETSAPEPVRVPTDGMLDLDDLDL